jgi:glycosyltransferase involved in cell wall biosynthesis
VGRLTPAKGQAILLSALAILAARGRHVHLGLVGDGPDRNTLQDLAARLNVVPNVTFHGALNQDGVASLLSRADLFVLPSFAEGVPVSLMEAMAMEVPCISTAIAGIPELIQSGEEGILVPPSDPGLLAEAIEELFDNAALRLRLGQAGRRKIISGYNLRTNTEHLAKILESRLASRESAAQAARGGAR